MVACVAPASAQTFGLTHPPSVAPPVASAPPSAEQQALFARTLREPTNHELTFTFVRVATANGDFEAAIGALERLLFFEPRLTRVKYELGVLYQRLGSFEMAARYYREALASPTIDSLTRSRIEAQLPGVEKMLSPSRFSVFAQTGLRYQSNANYVPSSGLVRLGGLDFPVPPAVSRKPDWNWFGLATLNHDYDLQNQRGDVIETRFVGYLTRQSRFQSLSLGLFEVSFGPRLALAPDALPGVTVKPYVVGGAARLDGGDQLSSAGAGVLVGIPMGTRFTIEPGVEWRRANFTDRSLLLVSSINSGTSVAGVVASRLKLADGVTLAARAGFLRLDGTFGWQSSRQISGEAALTFEFDPPFERIPARWTVAPYVRLLHTGYAAPNPVIDPAVRRRDTEWRAGVMLDMPITPSLGVAATIQYSRVDSNLPNYRNGNFSVVVGPTARF